MLNHIEDKADSAIIVGDSFVFGEGLELYLDTPFWIKQRKKVSEWMDLEPIQTPESTKFREDNRYVSLVSKKLNLKIGTVNHNGEDWGGNRVSILKHLRNNPSPKFIIIHLSSLTRNNHHIWHSEDYLSGTWRINDSWWNGEVENSACRKYFSEYFNTTLTNENFLGLTEYFNLYLAQASKKFLYWVENLKIPVFYIDSWEDQTSNQMKDIIPPDKYIPLNGPRGIKSRNWMEWRSNFDKKYIKDDFPRTNNYHPTLEQHQWISKSIVDFIKSSKNYMI